MRSELAFIVRKSHKWFSLVIGVQVFLWLATGVYMVVVDLDFIHGDHLVRNLDDSLPPDTEGLVTFDEMRSQFPQAQEITLMTWSGSPHYRIIEASAAHLIDARSGVDRSPLSEADAITVAKYHYAGDGLIIGVTLIDQDANAPSEIQSRPLPLWQVRFDDFGSTVIYISPVHGHLVAQRHVFWRVFDFSWMLHIMDYKNRSDVNNNLFRFAALLGLLMSLSGLWLLYYSFSNTKVIKHQSASGNTTS